MANLVPLLVRGWQSPPEYGGIFSEDQPLVAAKDPATLLNANPPKGGGKADEKRHIYFPFYC